MRGPEEAREERLEAEVGSVDPQQASAPFDLPREKAEKGVFASPRCGHAREDAGPPALEPLQKDEECRGERSGLGQTSRFLCAQASESIPEILLAEQMTDDRLKLWLFVSPRLNHRNRPFGQVGRGG
jgi:hypothetical protein